MEKVSLKPSGNICRRAMSAQPARPAAKKNSNNVGACVIATIEDNAIVFRLPLFEENNRRVSGSGKSILCATTRGPKQVRHMVDGEMVPIMIDGKPLRLNATAYVPVVDKNAVPANKE